MSETSFERSRSGIELDSLRPENLVDFLKPCLDLVIFPLKCVKVTPREHVSMRLMHQLPMLFRIFGPFFLQNISQVVPPFGKVRHKKTNIQGEVDLHQKNYEADIK